jgi:hypothetical protein
LFGRLVVGHPEEIVNGSTDANSNRDRRFLKEHTKVSTR